MDEIIVQNGLITFLVFLGALPVVFRLTHQDEALRWIGKLYCFIGAVLWFFIYTDVTVLAGSFLVFTGLVSVFVFCVFGVIEGSVTLRILAEIEHAGSEGISRGQLLVKYNKTKIIRRRLERFVWSGDLVFRKGKYYRTSRITLYKLREAVVSLFKRLFPDQ